MIRAGCIAAPCIPRDYTITLMHTNMLRLLVGPGSCHPIRPPTNLDRPAAHDAPAAVAHQGVQTGRWMGEMHKLFLQPNKQWEVVDRPTNVATGNGTHTHTHIYIYIYICTGTEITNASSVIHANGD